MILIILLLLQLRMITIDIILTMLFSFLSKFCKRYKRKFSLFSYIFIAEYHKDGAIHFHGLCFLPPNAIEFDLYSRTIRNQK